MKCDYDAWNRLVRVRRDRQLVVEYEYDGLGRRIVKRDHHPGWQTFTHPQ